MSYGLMAGAVGLATYAAITLLVSAPTVLLGRAARHDPDRLPAAARARGLFLLRLLPAGVAALMVFGLVLPAFHRFEPRGHDETLPRSLLVLAAVGAVFAAAGLARACRTAAATRRLPRAWAAGARPLAIPGAPVPAFRLASEFPLVAIIGMVRPRLFVSDRVLDVCTPHEIEAIVAHEAGHLAARDNLRRMMMRCCPDLLTVCGAGAAIDHDWRAAAEEAADDCASRAEARRAVDLAGALVKVSRLMPPGVPAALPASALYHGEGVERRVRRLLGGGTVRPSATPVWLFAARALGSVVLALGLAGAFDTRVLLRVQHIVELVVSSLP
jgi:hypothetical protein